MKRFFIIVLLSFVIFPVVFAAGNVEREDIKYVNPLGDKTHLNVSVGPDIWTFDIGQPGFVTKGVSLGIGLTGSWFVGDKVFLGLDLSGLTLRSDKDGYYQSLKYSGDFGFKTRESAVRYKVNNVFAEIHTRNAVYLSVGGLDIFEDEATVDNPYISIGTYSEDFDLRGKSKNSLDLFVTYDTFFELVFPLYGIYSFNGEGTIADRSGIGIKGAYITTFTPGIGIYFSFSAIFAEYTGKVRNSNFNVIGTYPEIETNVRLDSTLEIGIRIEI